MSEKIISENRTNFYYSVGNVEGIKKGNLEKTILTEDTNYKGLLENSSPIIFIPKIVGVYQSHEIINPKKGTQEICDTLTDLANKMEDYFLSKLDILDNNNAYLIHIVYDPYFISTDILKQAIKDEMKRIVLSPYDSVPNFFEKDILKSMEDLKKIIEGFNMGNLDPEQNKKMYERSKSIYENLKKDLSKFGLTKIEWVQLNFPYIYEVAMGISSY